MLTRYKRPDRLKEWGDKLMKSKCRAKASVAVARKMAVIMHAMWKDGTDYHGAPAGSTPPAAGKLYLHEPLTLTAAV